MPEYLQRDDGSLMPIGQRLRPPDKRSRQLALMRQASIVLAEARVILEQLEELIMTPEEGSDGQH